MGINQVHLFLIFTASCLICIVVPQFMPGTSPGTPNHSLDTCQKRAGIENTTNDYKGLHAPVIGKWCSIYDKTLLCLNSLLPIEDDTNDWYLSLVYDYDTATKMSQSVCARLSLWRNLTCVDEGISRVMKCMRWTTQTAVSHFYRLHNASITGVDNRDTAEIYGCLISAGTANCFRRHLISCPRRTRKLMYDYYMMLSGRCKQIAAMHAEKSKTNDTTDDSDLGPEQTTITQVVQDDSRAEVDRSAETAIMIRTEKVTTPGTLARSTVQPPDDEKEKAKIRSRTKTADSSKRTGNNNAATVCLSHVWIKMCVLSISIMLAFFSDVI